VGASVTRFYLGVDVGTGSVRAAVFDANGVCHGTGVCPIRLWRPAEDFVEQSSDDIWKACASAVGDALGAEGIDRERIGGIGFDATCSLVALDARDRPVTVSPSGRSRQNVIVWMDHRAVDQAARINATGHEVLRYVGGTISPEMQMPKLLWLKENMPTSFRRAARFLDLADFLTSRATGRDVRSLCTTACKWTHLGHERSGEGGPRGLWRDDFFSQIGLEELAGKGHARIGETIAPPGDKAGELCEKAATELGLVPGIAVAVGIIDAHAGGLGVLGALIDGSVPGPDGLERRLALIGGTSSCHMAVSRDARFVPGVWGPYFSAMVPEMWLNEGGQSATGALIDHTIGSHVRAAELAREARRRGTSVYVLLNERLETLGARSMHPAELTRDLHVLPYHHGNRSPRADPTLRGVVSGLKLTDSVDSLALLYLATIQALAHGTRHILETLNANGYRIDAIFACGGDTKNPVFVREHADATGCRVVLPREPEAVLLGAALLGAVASGDQPSVLAAMSAMDAAGRVIAPHGGAVRDYHEKKHAVFQRMYDDHVAYRGLMS
jgi:D-ribulokinase